MKRAFFVLCSLWLSACSSPTLPKDEASYAPPVPVAPLPAAQTGGAIWQDGFASNLYSDRKAYRVGDLITVNLSEHTQASKRAGSQIQKDANANIGLSSLFGANLSIRNPGDKANPLQGERLGLNSEFNATRSSKGNAQAGQSNSLFGSITVSVTDVLPGGTLLVRGEKWLTLNTGDELVRISGRIRSDDIGTDNSVLSTRIADAKITYSGTGSFADASRPGWLQRFFMSPLWPF